MPQTLEHLYHPQLVMRKIYHVVRPGGYLYTHQPYINRHHMKPFHFSHWTGTGLLAMMVGAGFNVVEYSDWGNEEYIKSVMMVGHWPTFEQIKDHDQRSYAQTAVLLRRPTQ